MVEVNKLKKQPLILRYAEEVNEIEPKTQYSSELNLNVIPEKENVPFCVNNKNLWAQRTKTLAIKERDD